jgi:hypothetical protein
VHGLETVTPKLVVLDDPIHQLTDAAEFLVRRRVHLCERAVLELLGCGLHDGRPATFPEDLHEALGLAADPAQMPPFFDDQRPAHDRHAEQDDEDELRHRARVEDQFDDAGGQGIG